MIEQAWWLIVFQASTERSDTIHCKWTVSNYVVGNGAQSQMSRKSENCDSHYVCLIVSPIVNIALRQDFFTVYNRTIYYNNVCFFMATHWIDSVNEGRKPDDILYVKKNPANNRQEGCARQTIRRIHRKEAQCLLHRCYQIEKLIQISMHVLNQRWQQMFTYE